MLEGQRFDDLVSLCQGLVRTPSLSGGEGELAKLIVNTARVLGYDKISVDSYGNVLLHMNFSAGGRKLLFHSQMDHVDPGNPTEWSFYPYGGVITNKKLYGRGAADQKGALAAMIQAGAYLKEDLVGRLNGELIIAAVVQQELFGGCSSRAIASLLAPDAVVAGEASDLNIVRGQRGRAKILVKAFGRIAHSSYPERGINAADIMLCGIASLRRRYVVPEDPFLGRGEYVLTGLYTTPPFSEKAIPDRCTAFFERRVLLKERREMILDNFTEALKADFEENVRNSVDVSLAVSEGRCYTGAPLISEQFVSAWIQEEDSTFLKVVARGLRRSGIHPNVSHSPGFGTSGCIYAAEQGLPTVIFGPCHPSQPHSVDEFVELDQLFKACEGYYHIAAEFLKA